MLKIFSDYSVNCIYFRELGFFFPNFVVPTVQSEGAKVKVQRTLALIRPDALKDKKGKIMVLLQQLI